MSKNLTSLSFRKGLKNNLFEQIGQISEKEGSPNAEDLRLLAEAFLMGEANVYGAASFYDFSKPENKNKKAYICNGTACMLAGTQANLKDQLSRHFKEDEIGDICCLGRCHENHAFHYNGKNYSANDSRHFDQIISGETREKTDQYAVSHSGHPVLTTMPEDLQYFTEIVESMFAFGPKAALGEIKASGLRGRGGAGFPIAKKMEAVSKADSDIKFIVCNADEGDPGSYSDRYLLEKHPLAVLIGMLISGYATGANNGVVYIRAEYPESVFSITQAIEKLREQHFIGKNIFGSGFDFDFKVIKALGAYICGEETALLASIEGQRPEVRVRPPYPAEYGLFGQPTLVNNVETLANLPFILSTGEKDFKEIGTANSSGTKLLSFDSAFNTPGVFEVEMGIPLKKVIGELAGGFKNNIKALQIGGPLGGIVPAGKIEELTVDFESFDKNGFLLGHASVVGIPEDYPMIAFLEHLFEFTAHESCGKCFPCRLGSVRGMELLQKAQNEVYQIDKNLFTDLLETLEQGSLCGLGGGMPLPIRNALKYFKEELEPFFKNPILVNHIN